ncbi:MAG TPA: AbrB/MazE/SpoVT family DNA-binding domain-containing protein [Acidobacteriota bacterium]|nr:AbrB/MazE/SpoVT family DNA-binding domain-containing protein [Acidobacteriota bacterium]
MQQEKKERKIVKHGPSSYIVSLPLQWIKKNNLNKGDDVLVTEINNSIIIDAKESNIPVVVRSASFDASEVKDMTTRYIHALYKKGIDIVTIKYSSQEQFDMIRHSLGKESIGYEIVEATDKQCIIKRITQLTKEFKTVLRQSFLVTLALSEETYKMICEKKYSQLKSTMILEESNNKFTTYCRCYINTYDAEDYSNEGPLYYILETLENIADEYKYICQLLADKPATLKLNPLVLGLYAKINASLRLFYEHFYKSDFRKISQIRLNRNEIFDTLNAKIKKLDTLEDARMYHHLLSLNTLIFSLVDPSFVLTIESKEGYPYALPPAN